jgi:hypothetical protein
MRVKQAGERHGHGRKNFDRTDCAFARVLPDPGNVSLGQTRRPAGLYGGATASRRVLVVQALPAAIGLALLLMA